MSSRPKMGGIRAAMFLCLAGALGSASAQLVGTYVGEISNDGGHKIQLEVKFDADAGVYYIDSINGDFTLTCPRATVSQEWSLGWSGYLAPVVGTIVNIEWVGYTSYVGASFNFTDNTQIDGKIRSAIAEFTHADQAPPRSTASCKSLYLNFTAYWSPTALPRDATAGQTAGTTIKVQQGAHRVEMTALPGKR